MFKIIAIVMTIVSFIATFVMADSTFTSLYIDPVEYFGPDTTFINFTYGPYGSLYLLFSHVFLFTSYTFFVFQLVRLSITINELK